jgi:hypothetical protein
VADVFEALAAPARRAILDELFDRDGQSLFEPSSVAGRLNEEITRDENLRYECLSGRPARGACVLRLRAAGVRFTQEPVAMGGVATAVFDDTGGNLIQIVQR